VPVNKWYSGFGDHLILAKSFWPFAIATPLAIALLPAHSLGWLSRRNMKPL